ncbi:hypothetical protein CEUSTIGMA_g3712.t1 [Chlamydomonas eustigma]|uniref:glycerol-3-phosphate dehydrogenase (NAD(+)) n=1 Tax=Chlamydomonas eustigma TaxID=1157962 RepID=A0A250WZK3_9CHLO|nr:hypothetical protein CEUSTIGMA_g3712.t1 [Chlamydomonas eustigma]|eukprot:GAX76268.1 hypothetical protein CEUSTIGMA_g3712.t1 [Chlamydomonas eustigma]
MGANIADELLAKEKFGKAVIGYDNIDNARILKKLFQRPYFRVNLVPDVAGAEMCGTLKSVAAIAAGLVEGLGYGANSKAAIMRQGLSKMMKFSIRLYPGIREETFLESCGVADLVATFYGGRNRMVVMEYAKNGCCGHPNIVQQARQPESFDALEAALLNGQKLQGVMTSEEVQEILATRGWEKDFPLFTTINRIINYQLDPSFVVKYEEGAQRPVLAKQLAATAYSWLPPPIPSEPIAPVTLEPVPVPRRAPFDVFSMFK